MILFNISNFEYVHSIIMIRFYQNIVTMSQVAVPGLEVIKKIK